MKFYLNTEIPKVVKYPFSVLYRSDWDDFGYKTSHNLEVRLNTTSTINLGQVKILQLNENRTKIPDSFDSLGDNYFSLGQSIDYYEKLKDLDKTLFQQIVEALNDVALDEDIAEIVTEYTGFESSLLRDSEARDAWKEAKYLFYSPSDIEPNYVLNFDFEYSVRSSSLKVNFDFLRNEHLPHRINAIIGENGTGKTRLLARLANSLSRSDKEGSFFPEVPIFSRVITLSYSYFDEFEKPHSTETYNYKYCGLKTSAGLMTRNQQIAKYQKAIEDIKSQNRLEQWKELLSEIFDEDILDRIDEDISRAVRKLSSGQNILLATITDVIANIKNSSLILYDEPELYLHPTAVSNLAILLGKLLEKFDSYAIISTHSPLILQDIPSKYVRVIQNNEGRPMIRPLGIECFGDDLTGISEEVFGVTRYNNLYKIWLTNLAQILSYEEILDIFNNKLSFNAKVYLKTQIDDITGMDIDER
ncbi:AAA family ATPase [Paenibacillus sp. FSL R10-2199]|uniref:AAA family ATPase n=1 Tax=Paenibacillus sp. FSL R10-2199 TaxID=2975348 RepID=UPI0030F6D9A7